jgi:hypothetical protein
MFEAVDCFPVEISSVMIVISNQRGLTWVGR